MEKVFPYFSPINNTKIENTPINNTKIEGLEKYGKSEYLKKEKPKDARKTSRNERRAPPDDCCNSDTDFGMSRVTHMIYIHVIV